MALPQPSLMYDDVVARSLDQMRVAANLSMRYYGKPILICYSGGKDSEALLEVAKQSGVEFEVMHSLTTADAPETVMHVRKTFSRLEDEGVRCEIKTPTYKGARTSMWRLIPQKLMPPTRLVRYCCLVLKETGGKGRAIATGVRREESTSRRDRKFAMNVGSRRPKAIDFEDAASLFEDPTSFIEHDDDFLHSCRVKGKTSFQPILEWTEGDVLAYLEDRGVELNPLYSEGFRRVGCVGCPFAGRAERMREFHRWPAYERAYRHAFGRMLENRRRLGRETEWETADDVFDWWVGDGAGVERGGTDAEEAGS